MLSGCAAALIGKASSSGAYGSGSQGSTPRPSTGSGSQGSAGSASRTSAQAAEDRRITAAVRSKLLADPVAKALVVGIETYQGVVTLRGDAQKAEQRSAAERVARSVAGVRGVRNEMRVR
jgi:osmotically-inducible protein OsmY